MLIITSRVRIPVSEMELSYVRSSGPGGQNVNKVNSKAVLRWNLVASPSLDEESRARLMIKLEAKLTLDGELVISSDRFRDQTRNREDCYDKLKKCLAAAMEIPKARKKTSPSKSSQRKSRENKIQHSKKKSLRRSPPL